MQQTKRRGKKGVILLALAIALLVVAIVPAAAMAADRTSHLAFQGALGQNQGPIRPSNVSTNGWFSAAASYSSVVGTFTATPASATTQTVGYVYKIDGLPVSGTDAGVVVDGVAGSLWPLVVTFGAGSTFTEGLHTIDHWSYDATPTPPGNGAQTTDVFGVDKTGPTWSWSGIDEDVFYSTDVNFTGSVTDPNGSGVAATPTITASGLTTVAATMTARGTVPDAMYAYDFTGTVKAPTAIPPSGTLTELLGHAHDMVGNIGDSPMDVSFDIMPPHSSFTTIPVGASDPASPATNVSYWTNVPITVNFTSSDSLPTPNAGVDYTEYIIKTMTASDTVVPTVPKASDTGIQADSVVISTTAPQNATFLYFRAVDKAVPANKEAWHTVRILFDNVAPVLDDDVPSWWIDAGTSSQVLNGGKGLTVSNYQSFEVTLSATDPNSGLLTSSWLWDMPTWSDWTGGLPTPVGPYVDPQLYPDHHIHLYLDKATHETDGMFALNYEASDNAKNPLTWLGNKATKTATVKIDTRAPSTDGEPGYGDSPHWIDGTKPFVLTATDEAPGAGVAATLYRVDQATSWDTNAAATPGTQLETAITLTGDQGSVHQVDFGSLDAALPFGFDADNIPVDEDGVPSYNWGNSEFTHWVYTGGDYSYAHWSSVTGYKSESVKLDKEAPVVTAQDPKNGNWQQGPAVINFSGTDVGGSGFAYAEWSTDGGTSWTKGSTASIGGDGVITVTYRGVDNVGIKSANQTIEVKVSSTPPTVTGANASVKRGHKATFAFNVTSTTPKARVTIQIRTKGGVTLSTHHYNNVTTGADMTRSFKINLKKGKYNIRISAVDEAGNVQTMLGRGTLTVK